MASLQIDAIEPLRSSAIAIWKGKGRVMSASRFALPDHLGLAASFSHRATRRPVGAGDAL
jgi:hypothetical protein